MIRALGSGWIGTHGFGAGTRTDAVLGTPERLAAQVAAPPAGKASRNYGRFDLPTRLVCHATQLALADAGYGAARPLPEATGLIGTGDLGTLAANLAYYRDFTENGRVLGRSNLFLYTLPTSPLAEAAILFRLRGPLYFLATGGDSDLEAAFQAAQDAVVEAAVPCMLVCDAAPTTVLVHLVERGSDGDGVGIGAVLAAAHALRRIAAGQDGLRA